MYHIQGVTIECVRGDNGSPIIGDNVIICSHVQIIRDVKIGDNVIIGAGCVVTKDTPDNTVVVENPARIINFEGCKHIQYYINPHNKY